MPAGFLNGVGAGQILQGILTATGFPGNTVFVFLNTDSVPVTGSDTSTTSYVEPTDSGYTPADPSSTWNINVADGSATATGDTAGEWFFNGDGTPGETIYSWWIEFQVEPGYAIWAGNLDTPFPIPQPGGGPYSFSPINLTLGNCQGGSDTVGVPTGIILPNAAAAIPSGFIACDGAAVSRATYAPLFSAIGSAWGAGDGSTTFNVPDLRDRVPVGVSPGGLGSDRPSARALASTGGDESITLVESQLSGHQHPIYYTYEYGTFNLGGPTQFIQYLNNQEPSYGNDSTPTGPTGDDSPHLNMQPFAIVLWIIKT